MLLCGYTFVSGGFRPVIAKEGPKWTQVVYFSGTNVKVKRVRGKLAFRPFKNGVTLREVARKFMCRKNALGLPVHHTKTAKAILKEARS